MLGSMTGAIGKRRRRVAVIMAGGQLILQIASETVNDYERSESERLLLHDLAKRSEAVVSQLSKELTRGRGHGISLRARDLSVIVPKSEAFDLYVQLPDKFQEECGCSPGEFAVLLDNVMDVMVLCRDIGFEWGKELNQYRRRRRFKYSARERLFISLCFCRQYQSFSRAGNKEHWSRSSIYADFLWLRQCLVAHPFLQAQVAWGTPQEREAQRVALVRAGVLPPGFENSVFICDGTKDLGKRSRIYEEQERDYSKNKGHGKSHLLFTDLFGKVHCATSHPRHAPPSLPPLPPLVLGCADRCLKHHIPPDDIICPPPSPSPERTARASTLSSAPITLTAEPATAPP